MLAPQPPPPVSRRREVAEMTVSYRQATAIMPGHVFALPNAAARPDAQAIGATPVQPTSEVAGAADA